MANLEAEERSEVDPRMAGLMAFNHQRKRNSREKLLIAATKLFCRDGYAGISIEDIATEAGVSRVTFYRHFSTKSAVALELFQRSADEGAPRVLAITTRDWRDRAIVISWLTGFFASDREQQGLLRVLSQANVAEADFSKNAQPFILNLIVELGKSIPAFAIPPGQPDSAYRQIRAWLLLYSIFDQSNRAATTTGVASDPMMIEVLADSFLAFVTADEAAVPA